LTPYPTIDRIVPDAKEERNAMTDADGSLTLEGLARILRDHAGDAASQFAQLREQDARLQTHLREQDERFRAELRAQDERYHAEQREQDARYQAEQREQDARFQAEQQERDARYQAEQQAQDARFQARMDELHREIGAVAGMVRDLSQISIRHMDEAAEHRRQLEEHRQYIRQIFARMEQSDARFEAVNLEIRDMRKDIQRILDAIERRGGNGGSRPEAQQP
jgi:DNA repair exonuclease SbcCD ATPase subunit